MPYHLHGICVHDGSAESGHYFTFIKDHHQKVWRKFNDIRVSTVDEKEVFEQSIGGHGTMTAYWLVYISEEMLKAHEQININKFIPDDEQANTQGHVYGNLLSQDIAQTVQVEN